MSYAAKAGILPAPATDPNAGMNKDHDEFDNGQDNLPPSKSQLKREADAVQKLGERLIALKDDILLTLDLPENLVQAIHLARDIRSHGALRRQKQYIGKLMRNIDATQAAAVIHELDEREAAAARQLHQVENWRDRLLDEGDDALADFLTRYPATDRQHLRQLVRLAAAERAADKPPKHYRALFRELRDLIEPA